MSDPEPGDVLTVLMAGMAQLHELFSAAVQAGFDSDQAMQIVLATIASAK